MSAAMSEKEGSLLALLLPASRMGDRRALPWVAEGPPPL